MASASIKEVARHARVSIGTVSNVLNRPDAVSPTTRQRVLDAITELGYVRNDSARQLRAGRSRSIALVVLDLANPFFTDVMRGVEAVADEQGVMVMVCNSGESAARERRHLDLLEEQRVQGVLITPVNDGRDSRIEQVADRHEGVAAALGEAAGRPRLRVVSTPSLTVAAGRRAAGELADLRVRDRPTAVFCANDLLALGVLQEMTRRGVRVPEDIAIVGYDDIEFAAAAAVPLSSVRQPREQLGRTAAQLLLEEVADTDRHQHRHVVFEPELVIRRSSAGGEDR